MLRGRHVFSDVGTCNLGKRRRRDSRSFVLKPIVRSKKTNRIIGKLFLIPGAPLCHIDDAPRNDLAHSMGIGRPVHSFPDRRSRSQASSRAAQSTAMVSGSKAALGLTRSTMLTIRVLYAKAAGLLRRIAAAGDFICCATIQFTSRDVVPPFVCCGAVPTTRAVRRVTLCE